jgi:hypothetical protein
LSAAGRKKRGKKAQAVRGRAGAARKICAPGHASGVVRGRGELLPMAPLLILFLVSAGHDGAYSTTAMQNAVAEVLGPSGTVAVSTAPPELSDAAAIDQGAALHAAAVVRVRWLAGERPQIEVRVHRADARGAAGWLSRVLGFAPTDDREEIGRAIGYTVLAMLPAATLQAAAAGAPPAAPSPGPVAAPAAAAPVVTSMARPDAGGGYLFVDVVGAASAGLGGAGTGWGGGVRGGWAATPHFRLALGAVARTGEVTAARATTSTVTVTAGGAATLPVTRRFGLALRVEAMAQFLTASHFGGDDGPSRLSRWLPGGVAALEGALWLSANAALVAAAGAELAAGRTDVFVGGDRVATIPQAHATAELGLRIRF